MLELQVSLQAFARAVSLKLAAGVKATTTCKHKGPQIAPEAFEVVRQWSSDSERLDPALHPGAENTTSLQVGHQTGSPCFRPPQRLPRFAIDIDNGAALMALPPVGSNGLPAPQPVF
jgi:hypothetical protein